MGIREQLSRNRWLGVAVGGGALLLGCAFICVQLLAGGPAAAPDAAFFTVDDGKTWFEADASNIPPFQYEGKEAVRAYVFECDGKPFVNHLERYAPQARKAVEQMAAAAKAGTPLPPEAAGANPEVKKPGAKDWVSASNYAKSGSILKVKCPDGKGDPVPVMP